jgi:SAM-dependent methyltransferase
MTSQPSHSQPTPDAAASAPAILAYDTDLYQRYDTGGLIDDALKTRELAVVLRVLETRNGVATSLDIGAATGRYPSLLAARGIRAHGVDCEPAAVAFARQKVGPSGNPQFEVADARALPFPEGHFDLITCMMGTAAHFPMNELERVVCEVNRCLAPGGTFIVSSWNADCVTSQYLSIYSEEQKWELRRNSVSPAQACALVRRCGLAVESVYPIEAEPAAMPLGAEHSPTAICERDLLSGDAGAFVNAQMFAVVARKASVPGMSD